MKANISEVGRKLTLGRGATLYSGATNVVSFISDAIATNSLTNSRAAGVIYGRLQGNPFCVDLEKSISFGKHYLKDSLRFLNPEAETEVAAAGDGTTSVTNLSINVSTITPGNINSFCIWDTSLVYADEPIYVSFTAGSWEDIVLFLNSYFMENNYSKPYNVTLENGILKIENIYNTATLKKITLVGYDFDNTAYIEYIKDTSEGIDFFEFSKNISIIAKGYEIGDTVSSNTELGSYKVVDNDEVILSNIKTEVLPDGSIRLNLIARNQIEDVNENITEYSGAITLTIATDGTVTTSAPDPEETANSSEIATARWVRRITAGGVVYKGPFDASAGNYNALRNSYKGWMYVVTTAGVIDGVDWRIGDFLIVDQDGGTAVSKIDNTESDDIVRLDAVQTLTNKTLTSPVLTGTPTAPTTATSDSSTKIATTQLVENKITALKNDNYFVKVGNVDQEVQGNKKWTQPVQRSLQNFTPTSVVESVDFISKNYDASNDKNTSNERAIIRDATNSVVRLRDSLYNSNINTTVKASLDFVLGDDSKYYLEYITDSGLSIGIAAGDSSSKIPCTSWIQNEISTAIAAITLVAGFGIDTTNNVISVVDPVIINKATGTGSYIIGGTNIVTGDFRTSVGSGASGSIGATSIGAASSGGEYAVGIGYHAIATNSHSIQIGEGTNSTANTFSVGFGTTGNYPMLDGTTGKIPNDRLAMDSTPTQNSTKPVTSGGIYTALENKANTGLDNLNASGQMVIDSQNGTISNCILEIPQNFKLELSNNVLTLKAGSVLTKTGSTYATLTTTEDRTITYSLNGTFIQFASNSTGQIIYRAKNINDVGSGSSLPADGSTYTTFFNTTDKNIYSWVDGAWVDQKFTYPICLINVENGVASFAKDSNGNDMIFNGEGFIGHHAFFYPNPNEGLIAKGFTANGLLASDKVSRNSLQIVELSGGDIDVYKRCTYTIPNGNVALFRYNEIDDVSELSSNSNYYSYVKNRNIIAHLSEGVAVAVNRLPEVYFQVVNGVVTEWTQRQPVRTATTEMLDKKQDTLTFDTTPTSGSSNPVTSDGIYNAIQNITPEKSSGIYTSPALTSSNGICTWNLTITDISFPSTATQGLFMCQLLDTTTNKLSVADITTTNLSNSIKVEINSPNNLAAGAYKLLVTRIYS